MPDQDLIINKNVELHYLRVKGAILLETCKKLGDKGEFKKALKLISNF